MPGEQDIVEAAAEAAETAVFEHYAASGVSDLDITVTFEDRQLTVDVYIDAGAETEAAREHESAVAREAIDAAEQAVDDLLDPTAE